MRGEWIAGSVRARLLAVERRVGPQAARELAAAGSFRAALAALGRTPYGRRVTLDLDVAGAQRAIAETLLLHLRLLAAWLPGEAVSLIRTLAAWFELANIEDRAAYLGGAPLRRPFELGALAAGWPQAEGAQSVEELRKALAASPWGDPGDVEPGELGLALGYAWARRVAAAAPEAARWAAGALALVLARDLFVSGRPSAAPVGRLSSLVGSAWATAATYGDFSRALPPAAAWALVGVETPDELWRGEARWWAAFEAEGQALLHADYLGRGAVVGCVALLAADARRISAALAAAARSGLPGVREVLDEAV